MGKYIVCSAWPYINAIPHLGNFIGSVLSGDVYVRYLRSKGEEAVYVSGSDEHGTPIEVEAIKSGLEPRELTDRNHAIVADLFRRFGISYDNYTRTESPVHVKYVQELFSKIYENGYVFEQEVTLPYCEKCGRFLPDRFVIGVCPHCGYDKARGDQCENCGRVLDPLELVDSRCVFCGSSPTAKGSKHWFFDLPKFEGRLREYIKKNEQFPENARNFSERWLSEGLRPRSLTRDNKWGIPAPFPSSEGKTIYVWMEAVLGYVSATVEWAIQRGTPEKWKEFWMDPETRNVHFIAKDNIPFHTIILPSLLMASGDSYIVPWNVASTEFLMFEGQKFSKSRGIGIDLGEAIQLLEPDYWRFSLLLMRPETRDTNFTWREFRSHVDSQLNDVLGNFIHRTLTFIWEYFDGRIPRLNDLTPVDDGLRGTILQASEKVGAHLDKFEIREALEEVIELARKGNQYLSVKQPWLKMKDDLESAETTLHLCGQLAHTLSILLGPFLPFTSEKMRTQLNLPPISSAKWDTASELALRQGHEIPRPEPLFRKLSDEFMEEKTTKKTTFSKGTQILSLQEFSKIDLKVGTIVKAESVPGSTKLARLLIDLGGGERRQSIAGLADQYKLGQLVGRQVAVVANLVPVEVMKQKSEVMILAADDSGKLAILTPDKRVGEGTKIR